MSEGDKVLKYSNKQLKVMLVANLINAFGEALTWTGLPLLVANLSGNPHSSNLLFLMSTGAKIFFTILGGELADRISRKKLYFYSSIVNVVVMGLLYLTDVSIYTYGFLFFISSAATTFQTKAIGPWFSDIICDLDNGVNKNLAKKSSCLMIGKLLGMGLGPLLYGYFGRNAIFLDVSTSIVELLMLIYVPFIAYKVSIKRFKKFLLPNFSELKFFKKLIIMQSMSSVLSFPLISLGIICLKGTFQSQTEHISLFWLVGSIGSLSVNFLMSKGYINNIGPKPRIIFTTLIFILGVYSMANSSTSEMFLISFVLITISNPVINNFIGTMQVRSTQKENRGRVYAYCDSAGHFFSLLLLIFIQYTESFISPLSLIQMFIPICLVRAYYILSTVDEEKIITTIALGNVE